MMNNATIDNIFADLNFLLKEIVNELVPENEFSTNMQIDGRVRTYVNTIKAISEVKLIIAALNTACDGDSNLIRNIAAAYHWLPPDEKT